MAPKTIGALLLVGGNSRRMGQDKAQLPYGNGTFLSHTAAVLQNFEEKLLSVGPRTYTLPGWVSVPDDFPNRGPIGGLYSALRRCRSDALLVLPCDLPYFPRGLVEYLTSFSDAGWRAWVLKSRDGRLQPLCGVYTRQCLPFLEQMLAEENGRMSTLLERAEAHVLEMAYTRFPDFVLGNVNTPQEYQKLKTPPVVAICGVKNSGKTTLCEKLAAAYTQRGLQVGFCKHDGHAFTPDVPQTDSFRVRTAGALPAAVTSDGCSMVVTPQAEILHAPRLWNSCDLVLLEGFKNSDYPKIEIVRQGNSGQPVSQAPIAIATDIPGLQAACPVLNLNHLQEIVSFINRFILHLPE